MDTKNLKKYGVKGPSPFNPFDQWYIFREMANHDEFPQDWYCEVIFFSKKWFEAIFHDPAWIQFYNFLLLKNIKHTEPHRIKVTHDTIWENFSLARSEKRMKVSPHIVETFKHLIFIATGVLPGFKVVCSTATPGPMQAIIDAYINEYGLKTYAPTMMYANYFDKQSDDFVYYSLQIPTSPNSITKNKNSSTARSDMVELLDLIDDFIFELNRGHLGPGSDYMNNLYGEVQFDFFHSESDTNEGVYPSSDMPNEDPKLLFMSPTKDKREFCAKASFVRGCVRISRK